MKIAFFEMEPKYHSYYQQALPDDNLIFFEGPLCGGVPDEVRDAEIVSVFICSDVTAALLSQFTCLKLIVTRSTGYDHIDLDAAKKQQILVCNVPGYATISVAEFTMGLMLCLSRKIITSYLRVRDEHSFSLTSLCGIELYNKNLGIVGTGNIGKHVAALAKAFQMNICAYDAFPDHEFAKSLGVTYCSLDNVFQKADVLTFHVPLTNETHHMLNMDNIKQLKRGSFIINTARGGIIQTKALVKALQENNIAGAALDVLQEECCTHNPSCLIFEKDATSAQCETVVANQLLIHDPRVIVTPHNAFDTIDAKNRLQEDTIAIIKAFKDNNLMHVITSE